jgi:hypothetical protein
MTALKKRRVSSRQSQRNRRRSTHSIALIATASALQVLLAAHSGPTTPATGQPHPAPAQYQVTCGT